MFIAVIEGKEVEVSPENLKGKEAGFEIVTPNSVPTGLVRQDAVDRIVAERVNKTKEKTISEVIEKPEYHEQILAKYNVTLKDGKAFGVAEADVNEIKKDAYAKAKLELEDKYKPAQGENKRLKSRVIETELKSAALANGVKPSLVGVIVKSYSESFDIDKDGKVFEKDVQGFKMDNSGNLVTPENYFLSLKKQDSFKDFFDHKPQSGSGAIGGQASTNFSGVKSKADLKNAKEKSDYITAHGADAYLKLPQK